MAKCGKGCMPECEHFTTGGCISLFSCPYKIETGYINSATSFPTYMEQYNGMSDDDIERCLERLSTCKATDVMNFDYSGTLAYIKRLKAENADLHEKLKEAEHRAEVAERALLRLCEETMRDKLIIMYPIVGRQVRDKQELYDYCIEQAEREIEEEKGE